MNRIPAGKTIAAAYSFTFSQLGSIIGLSWISLIAIAILQFLPYAAGGNPGAVETNPLQAGQHAIQGLGISILILLLFSVIYVALTRLALGQKPGGAIAHFALGAAEFRTFGAIVLLLLIVAGIAIGALIAGGVLTFMFATLHNEVITGVIFLVAMVVLFCAILFVVVRLGFLIVPVTVMEDHISLTRGWLLTQGNFWRILGVLLAITVPIFVLEMIAVAAIVGPELMGLLANAPHSDPRELSTHIATIMARHAPMLIGLRLVFAPFQLGLSVSASAFGYRSLTAPQ